MTRFLMIAPLLALAACQPAGQEVEVSDDARALANACLAEIGAPILPGTVTDAQTIELTEEQRADFASCVQRRS